MKIEGQTDWRRPSAECLFNFIEVLDSVHSTVSQVPRTEVQQSQRWKDFQTVGIGWRNGRAEEEVKETLAGLVWAPGTHMVGSFKAETPQPWPPEHSHLALI